MPTLLYWGGTLELSDHEQPVNVQGYDPALGVKQYRTISGALAFIHPYSGIRYHLVVHQAVHIPDLTHHLLCPMQCRAHGVIVNDCPRIYTQNPNAESHSIVASDEYGDVVVLPFSLRGVISSLTVEPLTRREWDAHSCPRVTLTDLDLTWDPNDDVYQEQEDAMIDPRGDPIVRDAQGPLMVINSVCTTTCHDAADMTSQSNFAHVLQSNVNISNVAVANLPKVSADPDLSSVGNLYSTRKKQIDSVMLARRWNIDRKKAQKTVRLTTQRGVRSTLHPSLCRRYPTNDRMLRYNRLPHPVFTDTLKAGTKSKRGNVYGQAYCTQFGWSRCHPMAHKSEAHETLSMLFKRDGVPPKIVADNSKEQSFGNFARKCREADCHLVNTEPHSPW